MDVTSLFPVWAYAALANLMNYIYAAGNPFGPLSLHLFTAGPAQITPQNVVGDFTEAAFTGYAAVVITPAAPPVNTPFDVALSFVGNGLFVCTTAPVSPGISILGYYVKAATTNALVISEKFLAPVPIINAGDFCNLACAIPLPFQTPVAL